jgi:hypothetical protein
MDSTRAGGFSPVSVADGYARLLLGQLFEPWAADLVARAGVERGDYVLDVASGLGPVARLAAAAAGPDRWSRPCPLTPSNSCAQAPPVS